MPLIEIENVSKRYGSVRALENVSLRMEGSGIMGLLGQNGAGKTTLINILTGYLAPTSGRALLGGHDPLMEPGEAKRHLGYLPEQPPLYLDMTAEEYLEFAARLKKVPKGDRGEQTARVMELTGITGVRGRLLRNLSKGYRQRVGLAQALLGFPKVLILDEPTVGLDPQQIIEIRTLIRDLARQHTVILSSHILSEVQEVCDHLLIIHHGKKVAAGTPEELERSLAPTPALEVSAAAPQEQVRDLLAPLPGLTGLTPLAAKEAGVCSFRLEAEEGADLREAVFRAFARSDLPLLELRRDAMTLEDIFLKLTSDDVSAPSKPAGPGGGPGTGEESAQEEVEEA